MAQLSYRARFLGGLLKRVGRYGMQTFADRLVLQKVVYLMQAFGIYLGYTFSWYLRGPYSPKLAADGFELEGEYTRVPAVSFADPSVEKRFSEFLSFIQPFRKNADMLELMASIHFLWKLHPNLAKSEILGRVKSKQPHFTAAMVNAAWGELDRTGLIEH